MESIIKYTYIVCVYNASFFHVQKKIRQSEKMETKVKIGMNACLVSWDMKEHVPLAKIFRATQTIGGMDTLKSAWIVFADNSDDMYIVASKVDITWGDARELCRMFVDEGIKQPELKVWVIEPEPFNG